MYLTLPTLKTVHKNEKITIKSHENRETPHRTHSDEKHMNDYVC